MAPNEREIHGEKRADVRDPIERITRLNDFTDQPVSPLITSFARFLVNPLNQTQKEFGGNYSISTSDFTSHAAFVLNEIGFKLKMGRAEISIPEEFINLTQAQLDELYLAVPIILTAGFPQEFAQEAVGRWNEILIRRGLKDSLPQKTLAEINPINKEITSAVMVQVLIVNDAEEKIASLDWKWLVGSSEDISDGTLISLFREAYPVVLKELGNVASISVEKERDQKSEIHSSGDHEWTNSDKKVLKLLVNKLNPKDATFLRDWLCIYSIELMGMSLGYSRDGAAGLIAKAISTNDGLIQAMERVREYQRNI